MLRLVSLSAVLALLMACNLGLGDLGVYEDLPSPGDDPEDEIPGDDNPGDDDEVLGDDDDDVVSDDDDVSNDDDDDASGDDDDAVDLDGDGFDSDIDCDDSDSAIHPGAPEIACDGVDNNCDLLFLPDDLDSDGDGFSPCMGDCDDSDPVIGNHMVEIECDGLDNDCDGVDDCTGTDPDPPATTDVCDASAAFGSVGSAPLVSVLDAADPTYGTGYFYETWSVTVPSSGTFTADLVSFDFDAWLEIYDDSCALIGFDDDSLLFLGTDASYTFSGGSGGLTIHVLATTYGVGSTGTYLLDVY